MKSRKKDLFVILLVIVMVITSFSACKKEETKVSNGGASTETGTTTEAKVTTEAKEKITIAIQTYSSITDYDENYLTKKLEDELGIDIEFQLLSADSAEATTQLSLMVASGQEMPDIVCTGALNDETVLQYGSNGVFIALNDLLTNPEKAPNFNAIESEEDKALMIVGATSADGNIYGLTTFEPETWNLTPYRQYINEAWLTKLNLPMPTTTDEFYEVLKAFATQDPNGNGAADEIAAYGISAGTYGENFTIPLMNSFVYYPATKMTKAELTVDGDGKTVVAPFTQEGWKQGLEYMNKLCTEGLMPASVFTDDKTQFMAILNNESANLVGSLSSGSLSRWNDFDKNVNGQEFAMLPPLKGPSGAAYSPYMDYKPGKIWFITSSCKNPELALKLGDIFYRNDYSIIVRFGEEDADWTMDKSKISNADYSKALIKDIWTENTDKFWRNINPRYVPIDDYNTWLPANADFTAKSNVFRYIDNPKYNYKAHPETTLGIINYTNEEAQEQAEIIVNVTSYVSESMAQFITGSRPLSDWDDYVKELEKMGLSTWVENAQAAFDRQ